MLRLLVVHVLKHVFTYLYPFFVIYKPFFKEKEEAIGILRRETDRLFNAGYEDVQGTQIKMAKLQTSFTNFVERLSERRKLLEQTLIFLKNKEKVNFLKL